MSDGNNQKHSVGGQALIEGVMMRSKSSMALAVRAKNDEILIESKRIKARPKFWRLPVLRGIYSFGSSLVTGVWTITRAAEVVDFGEEKGEKDNESADVQSDKFTHEHMTMDDKKKTSGGALGKGAIFLAVLVGLALSIGLFFFIPGMVSDFFYEWLFSRLDSEVGAIILRNLTRGLISITIFVMYLLIVSLLKDIRRNFQYHGAEHKTIACYEAGEDLTVENVMKHDKRHNRCGTTFMFFVMTISIIVFVFVDIGLTRLFSGNLEISNTIVRRLVFMGVRLIIFLPIVAGISFEFLKLLAKCKDNWFIKMMRAPGLALQRLTTKEPDEKMIEVAIAAFKIAIEMEEDESIKERKFGEVFMDEAKEKLGEMVKKMGIEDAESDWMLCFVLDCKRSEIGNFEKLDIDQGEKLRLLMKKRMGGVPLDYCFGVSSFYGRDVFVDERVLVPRSETEELCEKAIAFFNSEFRIKNSELMNLLDLCAGSGCIALTIAKECGDKVSVVAADIDDGAIEVARRNLMGLENVEVIKSDLFEGLGGRKFDVIVSNPPYIKSGDIEGLQEEVKAQPWLALDGGEDGLDFYRRIVGDIVGGEFLVEGGCVMFEMGMGQADEVVKILKQNNFKTEIYKDLSGIDRVVVGRK
ncbi:MAG: peptide chain release factor N(5)-glutamine methyltransferase [Defluviitaleaceae bacterium]|nr:peptide chain release factor N(5)-glutamine methyltransferase [Defluviitaleaceae bacterium]